MSLVLQLLLLLLLVTATALGYCCRCYYEEKGIQVARSHYKFGAASVDERLLPCTKRTAKQCLLQGGHRFDLDELFGVWQPQWSDKLAAPSCTDIQWNKPAYDRRRRLATRAKRSNKLPSQVPRTRRTRIRLARASQLRLWCPKPSRSNIWNACLLALAAASAGPVGFLICALSLLTVAIQHTACVCHQNTLCTKPPQLQLYCQRHQPTMSADLFGRENSRPADSSSQVAQDRSPSTDATSSRPVDGDTRSALNGPLSTPAATPTPPAPVPMFLHPMPGPRSAEAPLFSGDNLAAFLHEYERMCVRYGTPDDRAAMLVEDYCVDILSSLVHELFEQSATFSELKEAMRATWGAYDKERMLGTIEALDQLVASTKEGKSKDAIVFTRQFRHLVQRAEAAGNPIDKGQLIKKYLTGLSLEMQRRVVGKTEIDCLAPAPDQYNNVLFMVETITKADRSLALLNDPLSQLDVLSHLRGKEHLGATVGGDSAGLYPAAPAG